MRTCWRSLKNVSVTEWWTFSIFQNLPNISLIFAVVNIPVIAVLSKFDLLVMEHYRVCYHISSQAERKKEAMKRAHLAFSEVVKELKREKIPLVPISIQREALEVYGGPLIWSITGIFSSFKIAATAEKMLMELTQVTQDNLLDAKGSLRALWATAQPFNARQKVELSIRCVFFSGINMHWNDVTFDLLAKASRVSSILIF